MSHKLFNTSLLVCSLLYAANLNAQTDDLLASISNEMQHFNEVATVTKQNEHYQPYVISVFDGKELEKLGIVNLEEALGLVPGVDMATDNFNIKTPIFRGSNPVAYGQSKLFIDGVPANNVFFDAYSEHLKMPVEMIKRIEVVRGPGSKTDGYNAYAGSINVITYAENFEDFENADSLIMKGGSYKYGMIGFVKSYKMDDFSLTTDFSYQRDDKKLYAGQDGLSQGVLSYPGYDNTGLSKSGDAYLWFERYSLGATLNYKDKFYAKLRLLDHTQASAYGINLALTARSQDRLKQPNHYLELGYSEGIDDLTLNVKGGMKYDSFDSDARLVHAGLTIFDVYKLKTGDPSFDYSDATVFNDGIFGIHSAEQRTLYQSTFLRYSGLDNHDINLGYRLSQEKTISMISKLSSWTTGEATPFDYTESYPFFQKDAKRNTQAFFFEDAYRFSDELSLLFGLNYEQTSYEDAGFEPKVSMVYQPDTNNIYKLLYSKSHRNPSWQEMYTQNNHARVGSTEFMPERVTAYEAAYVYKIDNSSHIQSNVFYLKNSDQIQIVDSSSGVFDNVGDTTIYGLELEYKGSIGSSDSLYMNYSYITGDYDFIIPLDGENSFRNPYIGNPLDNVASHMFKGYYSYNITNEFSANAIYKYISSKDRVQTDTRNALSGYSKTDLTARYDNQKYNYSVMASVKNLFDSDIRFPSKPKTYTEDYIQEGRNFMVTVKKEF